ncbi:hypothetical protein, partial [Ensifer sp. SSB1]|uniref:hypothetical protein n=1 Tax=Ensifer sp. SSB1 TaxID=2795385 RepID=UPI0025C3B5CD
QVVEIKHFFPLLINLVDLMHRKSGESAMRILDRTVKNLMATSQGQKHPSECSSLHIDSVDLSVVRC